MSTLPTSTALIVSRTLSSTRPVTTSGPTATVQAGDPLERLDFLRGIFFPTDQSLGERTITLNRQSDAYPENVRWTRGGVTFATLHIVGSNNNLGRTPEADAEYTARNAANLEWLHESFEAARKKDSPGIMIAIQANPGFELEPDDPERTGFNDFLAALEQETLAFGKPGARTWGLPLLPHRQAHVLVRDGCSRRELHQSRDLRPPRRSLGSRRCASR